jgi:CDP-diacylglycerol--glycerol-3-phosphate 3-phosphatidyltransferase
MQAEDFAATHTFQQEINVTIQSESDLCRAAIDMSLYSLKPRFQALLRPLVAWLAAKRITANAVTLMAAAGSMAIAGIVMWKADDRRVFLLMPLWLFVRMALNAIDGMLAREFGQKSRLGAYLNEIGDVVSDAALYAPFAIVAPFGLIDVATVIFLSILTEFAGVLGPPVGASRRYDGPLGKSDRALVFGALACWIGFGGSLPGWLFWLMPAIGLLLLATTVNRVRAGLAEGAHGRIG